MSEPRFHGRAAFDSRAAFLAVQAITARAQVNSSPVLLAATCVGLARATGVDSHYIARAQVEMFLHEMEAVLVAAAFDPDVPTGV
jgi:hypothetical protein